MKGHATASRAVAQLAIVLSMAATLAGCVRDEARPQYNVLLIVADDLGYHDLGAYGNEVVQTPNIDALAASGSRFTRFYTAGAVCAPTRASLLTGMYPQRFGPQFNPRGLPAEVVTLPEVLRDAGYATHHVGKWHLGTGVAAGRPLGQGFDTFFGFLHAWLLSKNARYPTYRNPLLFVDDAERTRFEGHLTDLLTERAVARIRDATDQPWFLNLWYFAPHAPVQPPERWAARFPDTPLGRYYALIGALDEGVGRVLAALDESGQADDTIVIFLSDNGGTHPEHNEPLLGVKTQYFEGGVRVPMMVRVPGARSPAVVESVVSSLDILPTIAALVGAPWPDSVEGLDVSGLLDVEPKPPPPRTLFWQGLAYGSGVARKIRPEVRSRLPAGVSRALDFGVLEAGRWRFANEVGDAALFDLDGDPTGHANVMPDQPRKASELIDRYRAWAQDLRRLPLRAQPAGDAGFEDGVASLPGGVGHVDLVGYDLLRAPGAGAWSFGIGVEPQGPPRGDEVVAGQGDAWSLRRDREGRLTLEMGSARLVAPGPAPGRCESVVVTAQFRFQPYASTPSGQVRLYVDGVAKGPAESDLEMDDQLDRSMALGAGFAGSLRRPAVFTHRLTPSEIDGLSAELCAGE